MPNCVFLAQIGPQGRDEGKTQWRTIFSHSIAPEPSAWHYGKETPYRAT